MVYRISSLSSRALCLPVVGFPGVGSPVVGFAVMHSLSAIATAVTAVTPGRGEPGVQFARYASTWSAAAWAVAMQAGMPMPS